MTAETEHKDAEATEYVRELDDKQLVGLLVDIQQRIAALPPEVQRLLPMQQIENHHLLGLLEVLVGPEKSMSVREWHLTWVDRQLDVVEAQVRMQMLADLPGFP